MKPAIDQTGQRVQVDGGVGFTFETKLEDPLPVVTGPQIERQLSGCHYDPVLPSGLLPKGTSFKIRVSVNEQGRETGESFPDGIPWAVVQRTGLNAADCHFKPYMVNGQPSYYYIDFVFTAP